MAKFMRPETALARLAEDEHAPIRARVQALQQLTHPPLCMLRRLGRDVEARKASPLQDPCAGRTEVR
jgi:hypothetical protein